MRRIVFYSWQADLPNSTNRGFIQQALQDAASSIAADASIEIEPVVDRDTQGVPGSPDIASTIFAKITAADAFVADISVAIRPAKGKTSPNPNVLIELGYALRALGHEGVILVFNEAFGEISELPFDLRSRRLVVYNMPEAEKERAKSRVALQRVLDEAIRAALKHTPASEARIPAIGAIEELKPNRTIILRRDLDAIFHKLEAGQPKKHSEGGTPEELIGAIAQTQETTVLVSLCVLTSTAILLGSCSTTPSPKLEPIVLGRSMDLKGHGHTLVLQDVQQLPFSVAENRKGTVAYKALTFELSELPKTAHLDILMTVVTYACATKPGLPQGQTNVLINAQPVAFWSFGYDDQGKSYRTRIDLNAKSLRVGQNKLEIVGSVCRFGFFEVIRFNGIALVI